MEPRARAARHKDRLNFSNELSALLFAAGAPTHPDIKDRHPSSYQYLTTLPTENKTHKPTPFQEPFPETLRVMDEILTDFLIETCHTAVAVATYSGRAKLKLSDFEWVIRKDSMKLGRVQEMFRKKKELDTYRKLVDEKTGEKMAVGDMMNLGEAVGEEGTGKGKGRGRGRRRKKRTAEEMQDGAKEGDLAGDGDDGEEEEDGAGPKSKKARSEVG